MTNYAMFNHTMLDNDKVWELIETRPDAYAMWTMAILHCSRAMTDGVLSRAAQRMLGLTEGSELRMVLVEHGFLDEDGDVLRVHDYLEHQNSRESVEEKRRSSTERVRKHREKLKKQAATGRVDEPEAIVETCNALHETRVTRYSETVETDCNAPQDKTRQDKEVGNAHARTDQPDLRIPETILAECERYGVDVMEELGKLHARQKRNGEELSDLGFVGWLQSALSYRKRHCVSPMPSRPKGRGEAEWCTWKRDAQRRAGETLDAVELAKLRREYMGCESREEACVNAEALLGRLRPELAGV